jgi:hypothetical protein
MARPKVPCGLLARGSRPKSLVGEWVDEKVRERWRKERRNRKALQKNLMEFAVGPRKLGGRGRLGLSREPPSHVYLRAFDSLHSVQLSFKHNHGE